MFASSLAALSILLPIAAAASTPTVTVKNGTYAGFKSYDDQELFLGMPYAQAPLPPNLRLRAPQSLDTSWEGTRDATSYSPFCIGYFRGGASDDRGQVLSEDCLTLNVVRPKGVKKGSNLPVMLWTHGGGFAVGGSGNPQFNGSFIVERSVEMGSPIIFASYNYRVSALGFLFGQEMADEKTGNFGLLDQRLATRWIHENIAAFGGDPTKVTVMGESAGAISLAIQFMGYGETKTDLYRGAILESGTAKGWSYGDMNSSQAVYNTVASSTGCDSSKDSLACLRAVDINKFITATNTSSLSFGPVVDGTFVKEPVYKTLNAGKFVKVPLLLGQNSDEGTTFGTRGINNDTQLISTLRSHYKQLSQEDAETLLELYPNDPSIGCPYGTGDGLLPTGTQDKRSLSIFGDTYMHAGRRQLAELVSPHKSVYTYRFDQPSDSATMETGATHYAEVPLVFSTMYGQRPGVAELAKLMTSYWISFVVHQHPNDIDIKKATKWPKYGKKPQNIVFKRQGTFLEDDDYRKDGIAFLNAQPGTFEL